MLWQVCAYHGASPTLARGNKTVIRVRNPEREPVIRACGRPRRWPRGPRARFLVQGFASAWRETVPFAQELRQHRFTVLVPGTRRVGDAPPLLVYLER